MDNDLCNQSIMLIGGQDRFDELEKIWKNLPTVGSEAVIRKVEIFKQRAADADFNYNQVMCFLEM